MKKTLKTQKGFTIIEVVLVLAIAGLIFLIVFLALPQLQRSRRDTQRKNDVGRMLSGLESYAGNHNGAYPAASQAAVEDAGGFVASYLTNNSSTFNDPTTGNTYNLEYNGTALPSAIGNMRYGVSYECDASGNYAAVSPTSNRSIAVEVRLESGTYCQDNK